MTRPIDRWNGSSPYEQNFDYTPSVRNTAIMRLPTVDEGGVRIALTMHTDNIGIMRRFLDKRLNPHERSLVMIEGRRFPDQETLERFINNRIYSFYHAKRHERVDDEAFLVLPENLEITPAEVGRLIHTPFSPASLINEIGHEVVFYKATDIVATQEEDSVNKHFHLFAGCTQLRIGSDTLSPRRLGQIALDMERFFMEGLRQKPRRNLPLTNFVNSTIYSVNKLRRSI